jgi:hypothetical protein
VVAIPDAVHLLTAERGAVVKGGKPRDAKVYADPPVVAIKVGGRLLPPPNAEAFTK